MNVPKSLPKLAKDIYRISYLLAFKTNASVIDSHNIAMNSVMKKYKKHNHKWILKGDFEMKEEDVKNNINFSKYVEFKKFDDEKRMVYGIATSEDVDGQNEIIDFEATQKALKDYEKWRNLREMHQASAVGVVPLIEVDTINKVVNIGAKVVDDNAWKKVKEGVYKGFSIGGKTLSKKIEKMSEGKKISRVTEYSLREISLVDRPANPKSIFSIVKIDSEENNLDERSAPANKTEKKNLFIYLDTDGNVKVYKDGDDPMDPVRWMELWATAKEQGIEDVQNALLNIIPDSLEYDAESKEIKTKDLLNNDDDKKDETTDKIDKNDFCVDDFIQKIGNRNNNMDKQLLSNVFAIIQYLMDSSKKLPFKIVQIEDSGGEDSGLVLTSLNDGLEKIETLKKDVEIKLDILNNISETITKINTDSKNFKSLLKKSDDYIAKIESNSKTINELLEKSQNVAKEIKSTIDEAQKAKETLEKLLNSPTPRKAVSYPRSGSDQGELLVKFDGDEEPEELQKLVDKVSDLVKSGAFEKKPDKEKQEVQDFLLKARSYLTKIKREQNK